jgi:serine-type D-Ala-D-Ala carboxypeptidase/endopeptidase (penicillin-binding protein 4)
MRALRTIFFLILLTGCTSLEGRTREALLASEGARWGLVVMTREGRELVVIRPDERFLPASNTKLFPVAAAFHRLGDVTQPDPSMGASIRIEPHEDGAPDIVLVGGGDAMLIDAPDCVRDCLSHLADTMAANGVERVGDVIGDDRLYPDERWGPGWSQEDLIYRSGAPASALVVNSNEVRLEIAPGERPGDPVQVRWRHGDDWFALQNEAVTVEGATDSLRIERNFGERTVRVFGTQGVGVAPQSIPMAVDDPALVAAWRFRRLLEERGVDVEGEIRARHRPLALGDEPSMRSGGAAALSNPKRLGAEVSRLLPPPLIEDLRFLNKQSQNLHAEQVLRRLGSIEGGGSREDGLAVIASMLDEAGAERRAWDLRDGSGMSVYNRLTPRMVARFLLWTDAQPWSEAYRSTLPIGGVDGTLARRFRGTPLEGRIFAKTGTLAGTNALSGFMMARSGRMLAFSAFANDRPSEAGSATAVLDAALIAIAEAG